MPPASQLPDYWEYNRVAMLNYMEQCLYGIRGITSDSITGDPLAAKIEVVDHDYDNSYVVSHPSNGDYYRFIQPGTYDLEISADGYHTKIVRDVLIEDYTSVVIQNVELSPAPPVDIPQQKSDQYNVFWSNREHTITLYQPEPGNVQVIILSLDGRLIDTTENTFYEAGQHSIDVANNLSPGIYFCSINFHNEHRESLKLVFTQ
jgi:hypothetical protein